MELILGIIIIILFLFWKDIKEHATGFITLIIIVLALYAISVAGTYIFGIIAVLAVCFAIYGIIKIIKSNINEKEKKRLEGIETQINEIKSKYTPKELPISINEVKSQITFDRLYINTEINKAVSEFKKSTRQLICECKTVDQKINKFLSYNSDPDSVLGYLSENIQEFEELKQQSDSLHARIDEKRIVLLNEDRDAIECIKQAFIKLKKSKKCSSDNIPISALVEGKKPLELNMFSYKYEPLVLSFNDCCYCFFGNVILVFDNEGTYLNALDPTVLRLSVERYVESVYKSDGNYQNSRNTDSDSHIVTAGETKQTWMHTRLDGYPDLRYSYNPKISHHTDEVMYGRVSFYLSEKISYTFSSYQAIMALEKAKSDYEKRYNDRRNALPDFLNLMQMLEPENAMLDDISKRCKAKSTSYFCKVT